MLTAACALTLLLAVSVNSHGPPGVPPRQGGGPPPGMQGGQQQQPHQQQFHQQPDVAEGHAHERGKNFKFQSEIHNADHILDHLQNVIKTKPKEQMTEEELEFHYFKMHDYDNNNKLDGVEIGKALTHFHDEEQPATGSPGDDHQGQQQEQPHHKVFSDEEIANIVDTVITDNDENGDGYVEYFEFKRKQEQQRSQYQQEQRQHQQQQQQHH
ncbi:sex-determining region Y protein-like isoform X1 [Pomacea canaliculata]|uniref:sex-determining region Y protein-like isoform X1 n=1 Tax=Pomacea canaliculata TaxID=400727 RepID=UPI000D73CB27|nr:sex-determining region Y protein-like isoform X1 [Pomacea canaliculata]XP_025103621.1 sex-determining region Y protein-like isoform X1 [Pomacea canaliculata]XP_025103622.1 sex-determining region Y protein-like isoform X1 [Pomacea canaliculata]